MLIEPAEYYLTDSMTYEKPEPYHRLCLQYGHVTLQQRGIDNFAVRYGKQVYAGLTYATACRRLGEALMHQGSCDGLIDNRSKRHQ